MLAVAGVGTVPAAVASSAAIVKRVLFANNSAKLGGKTLKQVRGGINAAKLNGQTAAQVRANVDAASLGGKTLAQVQTGGDAATLGGKSIAQVQAGATEAIQAVQTGSVVWDTGTGAGSGIGPSKDLATLSLPVGTWLLHAEIGGSALSADAGQTSTLNETLVAGSQSFTASTDCPVDQFALFFDFCNHRPTLERLVTTAAPVTVKLSATGTMSAALSASGTIHTVTSNNAIIIAERVGTPTGAITIG